MQQHSEKKEKKEREKEKEREREGEKRGHSRRTYVDLVLRMHRKIRGFSAYSRSGMVLDC
jgi:hypothetical protein